MDKNPKENAATRIRELMKSSGRDVPPHYQEQYGAMTSRRADDSIGMLQKVEGNSKLKMDTMLFKIQSHEINIEALRERVMVLTREINNQVELLQEVSRYIILLQEAYERAGDTKTIDGRDEGRDQEVEQESLGIGRAGRSEDFASPKEG